MDGYQKGPIAPREGQAALTPSRAGRTGVEDEDCGFLLKERSGDKRV